jgi:hypothetical protein
MRKETILTLTFFDSGPAFGVIRRYRISNNWAFCNFGLTSVKYSINKMQKVENGLS